MYSNFKGAPLELLSKFHLKKNSLPSVRKILTIRSLADTYAKENRCLSPLQLCETHQAIRVVNEIFDTVRNFVDNHRVEYIRSQRWHSKLSYSLQRVMGWLLFFLIVQCPTRRLQIAIFFRRIAAPATTDYCQSRGIDIGK